VCVCERERERERGAKILGLGVQLVWEWLKQDRILSSLLLDSSLKLDIWKRVQDCFNNLTRQSTPGKQ